MVMLEFGLQGQPSGSSPTCSTGVRTALIVLILLIQVFFFLATFASVQFEVPAQSAQIPSVQFEVPAEPLQVKWDADTVYLQKLRTPAGQTRLPSPAFQVDDGEDLGEVYKNLAEEYLAPWKPVPGSPRPPVTRRMLDAMEYKLKDAHFRVRVVDGKVYYRRSAKWKETHRIYRMRCMLKYINNAVKEYNVSNTEFYVGVGDGPHIRVDTLMNGVVGGIPVFSVRSGHTFIDIPVPHPVEQGCHGEYTIDDTNLVPWDERLSKAFFRGSTSQFYFEIDNWHTAQRIKLAQWSKARPDLLDAGLSRVTHLTSTTVFGMPTIEEITNSTEIALGTQVPIQTQTVYKYIIDVDGGLGSARKRAILKGNSVLLRQDSMFYMHYEPLLRTMQHFVPLDFHVRDVDKVISFLQRNDVLAKRIADAGRKFAQRHLNEASDVLYWATVLREYTSLLTDPPRDTSDVSVDLCKKYPGAREKIEGGEMGCGLGWKRWKEDKDGN